MVRDRCGPDGAAKVFSLMVMIVAVAPMIAPLIGGWMVDFGWRAIFAVLTLFAALLLAASFRSVNETLPLDLRARDKTLTIFGQYRSLLSSSQLLSYSIVSGLMQSALFAYVVSAPFVLMDVYGIAPQYFGMVFFANTAGLIISSQMNAVLVGRLPPDRILGIGLLLPAGLSVMLITALLLGVSSLYAVLIFLFTFLVGHGFISPNASALGLSKHGTQAGTASAVMGAIQNVLGIVTIFVTSLFKITSALPLALVMGGCCFLAIACHRLIARPALKQAASPSGR